MCSLFNFLQHVKYISRSAVYRKDFIYDFYIQLTLQIERKFMSIKGIEFQINCNSTLEKTERYWNFATPGQRGSFMKIYRLFQGTTSFIEAVMKSSIQIIKIAMQTKKDY